MDETDDAELHEGICRVVFRFSQEKTADGKYIVVMYDRRRRNLILKKELHNYKKVKKEFRIIYDEMKLFRDIITMKGCARIIWARYA